MNIYKSMTDHNYLRIYETYLTYVSCFSSSLKAFPWPDLKFTHINGSLNTDLTDFGSAPQIIYKVEKRDFLHNFNKEKNFL